MAKRGRKPRELSSSVKEAWVILCSKKPWLIKEALERGLVGSRPLGFLELGARLLKEIGAQEENRQQVTIVFSSSLNAGKLRPEATKDLDASRLKLSITPKQIAKEELRDLLEDI